VKNDRPAPVPDAERDGPEVHEVLRRMRLEQADTRSRAMLAEREVAGLRAALVEQTALLEGIRSSQAAQETVVLGIVASLASLTAVRERQDGALLAMAEALLRSERAGLDTTDVLHHLVYALSRLTDQPLDTRPGASDAGR
jgi:hypothetical protein